MKPDGVTMETTEPTEAAAVAEPSNPPDNSSDQASRPLEQPTAAGPSDTAVNGASVNGTTTEAKPKSAPAPTKKQQSSKTESASGSRLGATSRQPVNDARPTNSAGSRTAPGSKALAPSAKPPGAVPKRPLGGTTTTKTLVKMSDKKPTGAASTMTNGTKPGNGTPKKTLPGAVPKRPLGGASGITTTTKTLVKVSDKKPTGPASAMTNGTKPANSTPKKILPAAKPKTTVTTSRPMGTIAPKPGTSSFSKSDGAASTNSSRPATAPTSRPATKASTAAATTKAPSMVKTSASGAATAPSTGRSSTAQHSRASAPAKKDVSRPAFSAASAAVGARNTTTATMKKPEDSKSTANVKSTTAPGKVDIKPTTKPQQAIKPNAAKKPAAIAARFPAANRVGQTPPGSPIHKSQSSGNTARTKQAQKPTQTVPHFTAAKRTGKMGAAKAAAADSKKAEAPSREEVSAAVAIVDTAAAAKETQVEAVVPLPQELKPEPTEPVESAATQSTSLEMGHNETESNTVSVPEYFSTQIEHQQLCVFATDDSASGEPSTSLVAVPLQPEDLTTDSQMSDPPKPTAVPETGSHQVIPPNLNEDEEEEEKEGSQLVSVSEMSGTTQPTEDSRPGSAGPVGASAWRVGGALLSELDSEEVSVSQQGASELSAPGVLEGTESMDDLGEGSLKGAMDMEGASAGSPDFEKVPEIPVNDYDEDDEDDNDRVCDMDVGSERIDEPQRLRHDNDVDDEEDEDVEMASEGVTESGLESYGNADEDDFAEDERLDNLNRVAQPPPPPPLLPSAPAAQWEQPNHFIDPWAQPAPPQIPSESDSQSGQGAEVVTDSPMTDPCQGDSETPTQEPAQAWLELGSATFTDKIQDVPQYSPETKDEHIADLQMYLEQPSSAAAEPNESLSPPCAPGTSPLSIAGSDTRAPDTNIYSEKGAPAPQPELAQRGEPEGAPVIEVLDAAHAPASNPSSSSVTEDEASDMEGEAQLEDSLETPAICNTTFEIQPQRALSTVEEGEEPEDSGAAEDATPPSANSQMSSGFDTTTSASNAQSTGESCVKSPGIFSLEELPEEAKEPPAQPSESEQPYIVYVKQVDSEHSIDDKMVNSDNISSPSPELQQLEQTHPLDDIQPPYYSAICEKTENSFAGNV